MVIDQKLQGAICHRLSIFRIPPVYHRQFSDLVVKWVHCSGVEWTVKRLKSLKVDLYRVRSGLPVLTPAKKNRKAQFSGVIGSLFRYAMKNDNNFRDVIQVYMCYSLFANRKLTDSQKEKFVTAVNATTDTAPDSFYELFAKFMESQVYRKLEVGSPKSILQRSGAETKKAPQLFGRSTPQSSAGLESLSYFNTSSHRALYYKYESLYQLVVRGSDISAFQKGLWSPKSEIVDRRPFDTFGGEVHFLQEPGLKLRAIASPYLVHQVALQPLGSTLYSFMETLPWDCTHDHSKPYQFIQQHLTSGRQVHSVDLSNATDYFPLKLQLKVLGALIGDHPSIDLFKEISRSTWISSIGPIKWKQGQPLGLYPSFAAFGITHGFLLLYLLGGEYNNQFFVLGDDVVILDDDLYLRYKHHLELLGCPYSPEKSLSSSELSEFAGKVITSKMVIPAYKWREVSDDNFLDLVRNYGRRAVGLLTAPQRVVVDRVKHLVSPFGLNWSYPGSNLELMTNATQEVFRKVDRDEQSLTGLTKIINRHVYGAPLTRAAERTELTFNLNHPLLNSLNHKELQDMVATFDEKVVATLQQVLPENWVQSIRENSLLGGFAGVPRAVGITDLPLAYDLPSRVTQLERYRQILGL